MKVQNHHRFLIGIDTGVNTGFCLYVRESRSIGELHKLLIHDAMDKAKTLNNMFPGQVFFRVEDARLRTWIPRQATASREAGMREGAGSVKRDAMIWDDFLKSIGAEYEMVAPKDNKTKMKAAYFKSLTKWEPLTNEHERDAAMLVFGF